MSVVGATLIPVFEVDSHLLRYLAEVTTAKALKATTFHVK